MRNAQSSLVYRLIKIFAIAILLGLMAIVVASAKFDVHESTTSKGTPTIYIYNPNSYKIWCFIEADDFYVDFYVAARSSSKVYYRPISDYYADCE